MKKRWILMFVAVAGLVTVCQAWAQQPIDVKRPASKDGVVLIDNLAGTVVIRGWGQDEVSVTGTLGKGAERLEFEGSEGKTKIRVVLPEHAQNVKGSDLEIRLPAGSRVRVTTVSADIDASECTGTLSLTTISGKVTAAGAPREVSAESVSGEVDLKVDAGRVRAKSVSGSLDVSGREPGELRMETVSGDVRYKGSLTKDGHMEVSTVSGEVEVGLPKDIAADFHVSTFSGGTKNELGGTEASTSSEEDREGHDLTFRTGAGGAEVRIKTFSGSITLQSVTLKLR